MTSDKLQNPGQFLAGIAALVRKSSGEYLLLKRSPTRDVGAGVWEPVTGRVNQGEGFEEALHREVAEETGLSVRIDTFIGLSHFFRGDPAPANELQGVIFGCSVVGKQEIHRSLEHSEYRWVTSRDAMTFLSDREPGEVWLRKTLARAEEIYSILPEGLASVLAPGITMRSDR